MTMFNVLTNDTVGRALVQALINLTTKPADAKSRWTICIFVDEALKRDPTADPLVAHVRQLNADPTLSALSSDDKEALEASVKALAEGDRRTTILAEAIFSPDDELAYLARLMRFHTAYKDRLGGLQAFRSNEEWMWVQIYELLKGWGDGDPWGDVAQGSTSSSSVEQVGSLKEEEEEDDDWDGGVSKEFEGNSSEHAMISGNWSFAFAIVVLSFIIS